MNPLEQIREATRLCERYADPSNPSYALATKLLRIFATANTNHTPTAKVDAGFKGIR